MSSPATSVDRYLADTTEPWVSILARLRQACRTQHAGYEEAIAYGMPSCLRDGRVVIAFKKQARYLSVSITKQEVLDQHRCELSELNVGKGCVRFTRPDQVDWALGDQLLEATAASESDRC